MVLLNNINSIPMSIESVSGIRTVESMQMVKYLAVPSVREFQFVLGLSRERDREYGIYILDKKGTRVTYITADTQGGVMQPHELSNFVDEGTRAVSFHVHYKDSTARSLSIFPSQTGIYGGDVGMHLTDVGGSFGIVSNHGLSFPIAVKSMSRDEHIVRLMRKKSRDLDSADEPMWRIYTGSHAGESFPSGTDVYKSGFTFSKQEDSIIVSFTYMQHHFQMMVYLMFVSWEKLVGTENDYDSIDGLCFEDGLKDLVSALKIQSLVENLEIPLCVNVSKAVDLRLKAQTRSEAYGKD